MKGVIRSQIKSGLRKFGINIDYVKDRNHNSEMYMCTLRGAVSIKKPFNIIQVGANDGKHNDLIYDFVKEYKDVTNIILIEPIKAVIPYLEKNYSYHPSSEVINKAIGSQHSSSIQLYSIDRAYWNDINTDYGKDWPNYRIPTGITTTNKQQLLEWISGNVQAAEKPKEIIREFNVEIAQPNSIINESQIMDDVDLLQVDVEGMDDEVVYSFFESNIYPNIINIEKKHLSEERQQKYDKKVNEEGYIVYDYTSNEKLAMK